MKNRIHRTVVITILILVISSFIACEQIDSEPLPDLVIESVTCKLRRDESAGRTLVYTVSIKNIGNVSASGLLYVSSTRSNEDLSENHYSAIELIKDAEPAIEPGEVFVDEITDSIQDDVTRVRLMVNPELETMKWVTEEGHIEKPVPGTEYIYRIEESDYKNNTYDLEIPEDIPIYKSPEREIKITKYTTTNSQYLVTEDPVRYTYEEISQIIQLSDDMSEDAKHRILNKVLEYVYTFPGYSYESISKRGGEGHLSGESIEVGFTLYAYGLSSGTIATSWGEEVGDKYRFHLRYDEITKECEFLSYIFDNRIIPEKIYENSVMLALEHPVVKDTIKDYRGNYDFIFTEWFDGLKGRGTGWARELDEISFMEPVKGIVVLQLGEDRYNGLWIFVDMFHGEIFTKGPMDFSPE